MFNTRSLKPLAFSLVFASVLAVTFTSTGFAQKKKPGSDAPSITAVAPAEVPSGKCTGSTMTADEVNQTLASHNSERAAQNLSPLKWDCKLAALAQEWTNGSVFEHRDTPYGENIFVGADTNVSMNSIMDMWLAEKSSWTNNPGTCTSGKRCGHYTQIVWKSTAKVGCGINRNASGKWKVMFVCNYDPSGNTGKGPAF